jgi:hypothetical protein
MFILVLHRSLLISEMPSLWPTNPAPILSTSATVFDPFESLQTTGPGTIDLLQPLSSTTTPSRSVSNDLDILMMSTQTVQQPSLFFPQQTTQQTFVRPATFQQTQPMMFPTSQQQFNGAHNSSFNVGTLFNTDNR